VGAGVVGTAERENEGEALGQRETLEQGLVVGEALAQREPEGLPESVGAGVVGTAERENEGEALGQRVTLGEPLALPARLALACAVVGLGERESEVAAVGDLEEEPHLVVEGQEEGLRLPEEVLLSVTDAVPLLEPVPQADALMVTVGEPEGLPEALLALLPVPLTEGLRLPELVPVLEAESVCVVVGVGELEGLAPTDSEDEVVAVLEVDEVGVTVREGLREGVLDTVAVAEGVLLPVALSEGVLVLVGDPEGVLVPVRLLV
jgi:hypothetical protein